MTKPYTHLTQEERYQIYGFIKAGFNYVQIACSLNRHISTIKREVARNTGKQGYRPKQADQSAKAGHWLKPKQVKMTDSMKRHIAKRLGLEWSPEQIQGRLKMVGEAAVCPQTSYAYIALDRKAGGDLYRYLRHKKYRKRTGSKDARGRIRNRIDIDQRPSIVDDKARLGDWEADTVIGKGHQGELKAVTFDNGKEFAYHDRLTEEYGVDTYFADPYS